MEASNLPGTEFKKMVIRMLKDLRKNCNKEVASIKKDIVTIENNQSDIKNTICEMKNVQGGINSRLDEAED